MRKVIKHLLAVFIDSYSLIFLMFSRYWLLFFIYFLLHYTHDLRFLEISLPLEERGKLFTPVTLRSISDRCLLIEVIVDTRYLKCVYSWYPLEVAFPGFCRMFCFIFICL